MTTVRSEMPATVWKVSVLPGSAVESGSEVVVLSSMKMEIPVVSPVDGTVTTVDVAEGDLVGEGDPLVSIEPAG